MTDYLEFQKFIKLLLQDVSTDYKPHLIELEANGKDPVKGFSWEKTGLTIDHAIIKLKNGKNVGIAALTKDALVIVDRDDPQIKTSKTTLTIRSRKRIGEHDFYFKENPDEEIPNIPTEKHGEVRANNQYVVAPGSFVPCTLKEVKQIPEADQKNAGRYTIKEKNVPSKITLNGLPDIFLDQYYKRVSEEETRHVSNKPFKPHKEISELYKLTFKDIIPQVPENVRTAHPLHGSDTGKNFIITGGLAHCWRHNVSLNVPQYLAVKYGNLDCVDAGESHTNGGAGPSKLTGNKEIAKGIWDNAIEDGFVKKTDKPPSQKKKYNIPYGYEMKNGVISQLKYNDDGDVKTRTSICHTPLFIKGRAVNIDDETVYLQLQWTDITGREHTDVFSQGQLYKRTGLLALLPPKGVEVGDKNASNLINFIIKSAKENVDNLNHFTMAEKFGWKPDGSFVLGSTAYTTNGNKEIKLISSIDRATGVTSKGTPEEWITACKGLLKHPRARFMAYAACAAPLLKRFNIKSCCIDNYGDTSQGKTTISMLATSIYGNPDLLMLTANSTQVGAERLANMFTDMPILFDETSLIPEKFLSQIVYMIANETGRVRGKKEGGLQETMSWKTIALFTGEAPIISNKSFGGQNVRVIELYGGLGAYDGEAIEAFEHGIKDSYGVIAPLLIKKIFMQNETLPSIFRRARDVLKHHTSNNGFGQRLTNIFAAILTGGYLFESIMVDYGEEAGDSEAIVKEVFTDAIERIQNASYTQRALDHVRSWINSNLNYFIDEYTNDRFEQKHEVYGCIRTEYIDVFPHILYKELKISEFSPERVLKDFKELEYIKVSGKGYQHVGRYDGEVVKFIRFHKNLIREKMEIPNE